MNLPKITDISNLLSNPGDFFSVTRTSTDRIVAKAKIGDTKRSKTIYPSNRVVEVISYIPKNK